MGNIIKIEGLKLEVNGNYLFNSFNLEIEQGSFVSIIGKNGSGKSMLIKSMIGLVQADGYINVDNCYLCKENINQIRRTFGVVFDHIDDNIVTETVLDNLVFSLENLHYSQEEIENELNYIVEMFKLENLLDKDPYNLNNSDKEKIAIASMLITKPKIIVLDDCVNQLSVKDKKMIFDILKKYRKKYKTTFILITHNLEDTIASDRIIVLDKGKIILDNTPFKIYRQDEMLHSLGFQLPFMVDLSLKLMRYNLVDHIYLNKEKLGDDLWK